MMSDELNVYHPLSMGFRKHDMIRHSDGVYGRGNVHTNTVEGFFGLLKRGIVGSFHHVTVEKRCGRPALGSCKNPNRHNQRRRLPYFEKSVSRTS